MLELGGTATLSFLTYNRAGVLQNASAITVTITLPDLTTVGPFTPINSAAGTYVYYYGPTAQLGLYLARWSGTVDGDTFGVTDEFTVQSAVGLISLAEAKAHLNLTASTYDDELRGFIVDVTAAIESFTNRDWAPRTVTRKFSPSPGSDRLVIPGTPSVVTSVTENGTTLTAGVDFELDPTSGVLLRRVGVYYTRPWLPGVLNVSVTYTVGSTSVPADIRGATLEYLRDWFSTQRGPTVGTAPNRANDDYGQAAGSSLPPRLLSVLTQYMAPGVA